LERKPEFVLVDELTPAQSSARERIQPAKRGLVQRRKPQ
jgi:hypothetical protein